MEDAPGEGRGRAGRLALRVPNLPHDDVPDGATEDDVREVRRVGEPPAIDEPREHVEIGRFDMERAARMSGARFGYWIGDTRSSRSRPLPLRSRAAGSGGPGDRAAAGARARAGADRNGRVPQRTRRTSTSFPATACTSPAPPRSRSRACMRARSSRRTSSRFGTSPSRPASGARPGRRGATRAG